MTLFNDEIVSNGWGVLLMARAPFEGRNVRCLFAAINRPVEITFPYRLQFYRFARLAAVARGSWLV